MSNLVVPDPIGNLVFGAMCELIIVAVFFESYISFLHRHCRLDRQSCLGNC